MSRLMGKSGPIPSMDVYYVCAQSVYIYILHVTYAGQSSFHHYSTFCSVMTLTQNTRLVCNHYRHLDPHVDISAYCIYLCMDGFRRASHICIPPEHTIVV